MGAVYAYEIAIIYGRIAIVHDTILFLSSKVRYGLTNYRWQCVVAFQARMINANAIFFSSSFAPLQRRRRLSQVANGS